MNEFVIRPNRYLRHGTRAFYHVVYTRMGAPGNPDFLNVLKNQFLNSSSSELTRSVDSLRAALREDLPKARQLLAVAELTICTIPRAKNERHYQSSQQLFRATVGEVARAEAGLLDATGYILRHTDTQTTHLSRSGHGGEGDSPYPGITVQTCDISPDVRGRDVLLVDDIYTPTINIDEDAIQALRETGANTVAFYAVGRVMPR